MSTILMCRPDFYGIEYEINVWMRRSRNADRAMAQRQWGELYATLTEKVGVEVKLMAPVKGLPDLVFTANAGLARGRRFILSNFRHPERQREARHFRAWFAEQGYEVAELPPDLFFEGAGDALFCGDKLFAGYRFRSDIRSHTAIAEVLGCQVLSLELTDPRFYHLDTCFCPLADDEVLYYPPAFDEYGRQVIEANVPKRIVACEADALRFGCNAVVVGRTVVVNAGCAKLKADLRSAGYQVHDVELSEFMKAGGSAKCLTLMI
ncbi:MAG: amidinotransferase [Planctomycetes bacterium]|nr:amidinotransferase [Planctomycetota bacterium]